MAIREIIKSSRDNAAARGIKNLVGLFGFPVGHSLSPTMHNGAFRAMGLDDWRYESFEVPTDELKSAVDAIRDFDIRGVNITIPHKENIIPLLDEMDRNAQEIGAVNTIKNSYGKLAGYNTDAKGFIAALADEGFLPEGKKAVVVGAGGAAHAVVFALKIQKVGRIFIYDIDPEKSRRLAEKFGADCVSAEFFTNDIPTDLNLIVNASPIGMKSTDSLPEVLSEKFFTKLSSGKRFDPKNILIYDLVYNRKTELIKMAEKFGFKAGGGLGMLLHQGAAALKLWTGREAPIRAMREILVGEFKKT